jgi:hypothetical protein
LFVLILLVEDRDLFIPTAVLAQLANGSVSTDPH